MSSAVEICSNCEARIGKLETPQVWEEHVVCEACHAKLSAKFSEAIRAEAAAKPVASSSRYKTPDRTQVSPGGGARKWGPLLAVAGVLIGTPGMIVLGSNDPSVGTRPMWAMPSAFFGMVALPVGFFVFAYGRFRAAN